MPRSLRVALVLVLVLTVPGLLVAQTVRGVVTDRSTAAVLPGVVVALLDATGASVSRALSNEAGEFSLAAPRAGAYRLRALRIGFRPVSTQVFTLAAGAQAEYPLALAAIPVALDTFRVTSRNSCEIRPDTSRATFQIWEQVRAALTAAEITERSRAIRARIIVYERTLEPNREQVIGQLARVREGYTHRPWIALAEDSLRRAGYVQTSVDGTISYYAPDLVVLLSDGFLADHCLRLSRQSDGSRIGIEFEPTRERRRIPEIRGTVWLDRTSAEARFMEFRYVNVPLEQSMAQAGGDMRFVRMKNGAWLISGWHIRMPVIETRVPFRGARSGLAPTSRVREVRVEGGELALATRGRDTLWARQPIPLRGRVLDSIAGTPWVDALVAVRGTELHTRTDATGRFSIPDVLPGEYTIDVATPDLEIAGVSHRLRFVLADSTTALEAKVPPVALIARSACRDTTGAMATGVVRRPDGDGVRDARVVAEWSTIHDTKNATVRWVETRTNQLGRFVLCGIPEREIELRVESDSGGADPVKLSPIIGRPLRADFRVSRTARDATLRGTVVSAVDAQRLAGVEVVLPALARVTFTNAEGGFRLRDVPPGTHEYVARRIGYRAHVDTLVFGAGRVLETTIVLSPVPTLESVDVTASARIPSFEEHRAMGMGHFLTRADLEKWGTRQLSTVLAQAPRSGMVSGRGAQATIVSNRLSVRPIIVDGRIPEGRSCGDEMRAWPCACYPQVYVDKMLMNPGDPSPPYSISEWSAERVEAIEWYPGAAETPFKYLSKQKVLCGVLVIHTRRYDKK